MATTIYEREKYIGFLETPKRCRASWRCGFGSTCLVMIKKSSSRILSQKRELMHKLILRFDQERTKDKTRLRAWYLTLGLKYSLSNYDKWSPEMERLSPNKIRYMYVDMFRKSQCTSFSIQPRLVKSYLKCLTR